MTLQAGKMYRSSGVTADTTNNSIYVVEQFNHRVSKWDYTSGSFNFTLDAGKVTSITVIDGGAGYNVGDPVDISAPTLDILNPINATAEVATESSNIIQTITVTTPGSGYDINNLPTVTATTGGSDADLVAVVSVPWGSNGDGTTGKGGPIGDGGPTDTSLYRPSDIIFDEPVDLLYVTDTFHNRVRAINASTGAFTISLGTGGSGTADFYHPAGIAISSNNAVVFIADELNHRVVRYFTNSTTLINPSVLADPSAVATLAISNPGTGYTSAPTVTITGGGGSGATATATSDGNTVDSITLTNGGVGYTSIPTVTISAPNTLGGTQATATATINDELSFIRPHGVVYDVTADEFNVGDSLRSVISSYSRATGDFQGQYGTPGTTADNVNLFYPASGKGLLTGTTTTVFADTRNNAIKTMNDESIAVTTGTSPGTGDGQLYYPESVSAFVDTANYVIVPNTLNNRVEAYSNVSDALSFQANFGSP